MGGSKFYGVNIYGHQSLLGFGFVNGGEILWCEYLWASISPWGGSIF